MNRFHHVFSHRHVVLPVIHVVDEEQSCRNAGIAREAGADGVFLINHDLSYTRLLDIHAAVVADFADWWVGVNCLDLDAVNVFKHIHVQVAGVWVDNALIDEHSEHQTEAEKVLHDREQLFLYQKHAKMRMINIPVFYLPYIVSPSPLRKKRKSGFLNPTINFNFLDTKTSQSTSIPYYFAISEDKEMLLTPTINYGGGVDASQSIVSEYDQLISGGDIHIKMSTDTNLENDNNESWLRDASIITKFNKNLNEKFKINLESAFQTSPTYLRRTDQNNILNRKNALSTSVNLDGYYLRKIDDHLNVNVSGYQIVRNNEDNKTTPTALPYIKYSTGTNRINETNYNQDIGFYNIFRDLSTNDHAQQQQKIYHNLSTDYEFYRLKSKINFKTELVSQFYNIENKKISERPIGIKYRINTCGTCGYMVKKVPLENETIKQNLMTNKQQVKKGEHNE